MSSSDQGDGPSEKRARRPSDDRELAPAAAEPAAAEPAQPLRRSTRPRRKPPAYEAPPSPPSPPPPVPERLEQVAYATPEQLGLADVPGRLSIRVNPVAMALMSFHAHLTRTEVIGYLGGVVRKVDDVVEVLVAEAFPARGLNERALAKTGRSAFQEVEIDPESSVEVMARVTSKRLCVVGWYHSHPDEAFTVEPSRVDIENQHNYQEMLFREKPFVAAIVAPYNEDLPDHKPDVEFFRVWQRNTPLRLPYNVGMLQAGLDADDTQPMQALNEFAGECHNLIELYCKFPKRKRLDKQWRGDITGVDKLRCALCALEQSGGFREIVENILLAVEQAWRESGEADEERARRGQNGKRKKRARRK